MLYYEIYGRVDSIDDTSYPHTIKRNGKRITEEVKQFTFNLMIPGQRDLTKVVILGEKAPKPVDMQRWEDNEEWVHLSCDSMREMSGISEGAKSAQAWAFVTFNAVSATELTQQERSELQAARKKAKADAKQRRDKARQEKLAARAAEEDEEEDVA